MANQKTRQRRRERQVQESRTGIPPPVPAPAPYIGIPASEVRRVFNAACRLNQARNGAPSIEAVISASRTSLSREIVDSLLDGALRIPPLDQSAAGALAREERNALIQSNAAARELAFVAAVRGFQPLAQTESLLRAGGSTGPTPDLLFPAEVLVCGVPCRWIEYKSFFGHPKDPFVYGRSLKQFRKYVSCFGPGMVVYGLGFQEGMSAEESVSYFREAEVLAWLATQPVNSDGRKREEEGSRENGEEEASRERGEEGGLEGLEEEMALITL